MILEERLNYHLIRLKEQSYDIDWIEKMNKDSIDSFVIDCIKYLQSKKVTCDINYFMAYKYGDIGKLSELFNLIDYYCKMIKRQKDVLLIYKNLKICIEKRNEIQISDKIKEHEDKVLKYKDFLNIIDSNLKGRIDIEDKRIYYKKKEKLIERLEYHRDQIKELTDNFNNQEIIKQLDKEIGEYRNNIQELVTKGAHVQELFEPKIICKDLQMHTLRGIGHCSYELCQVYPA